MQHDLVLRAAARRIYETGVLWADQPDFEVAERLRLPSYREAVGRAIEERDYDEEINQGCRQFRLAIL